MSFAGNIVSTSPQGPPGPLAVSVASAAVLTTIPTTNYVAGTLAYIQPTAPATIGSYWLLSPTSTATPNGTTVIAANGGGNWLLLLTAAALAAIDLVVVPIGFAASYSSQATLPAGAYILDARVVVVSPYPNGTTIQIGQTGTLNLLQGTGDNNPLVAGTYVKTQVTAWGASPLPIIVSLGGSPGSGSGLVAVQFGIAQS